MSDRGNDTPRAVDRRHFMAGATNALGAAALAGWLARPATAEGATPEIPPQVQATAATDLVVYQDEPAIVVIDGPGQRLGDSFYFDAALRLEPGGEEVGRVFGVKTVVRMGAEVDPQIEQRMTYLFFVSLDRQHQIVVAGVPDYPATGAEFEVDRPVVRAILGGTGAFIGARGQLTSTRHADGGYTQIFTLLE